MHQLSPDYFFDLSNFAHSELFNNCRYVWEVLPLIEEYLHAKALGLIDVDVLEGVILVNKKFISIGEGTIIEPGAYIKGPCIIGKNCQIRHTAYIRGNAVIGDHCVVGHATEVKNVIFLNQAQAPHFAYVGDSILGNHTNLGAGTKCANLRFDHQPISVHFEGKKLSTGLRKFGAIFGDFSQTGCNSVTSPGTLLEKNACIYPCANGYGTIRSGCIYKREESFVKFGEEDERK